MKRNRKILSVGGKVLSVACSAAMALALVPSVAFATPMEGGEETPYSGGSGTADDPYLISNVDDLLELSENLRPESASTVSSQKASSQLGVHFKMTNDIDLSSVCYEVDGSSANDESWTSIGSWKVSDTEYQSNAFRGDFDGAGHTISGLYVNSGKGYNNPGLFHSIKSGASVENLTIQGEITADGAYYVGGLAGTIHGTNESNGRSDSVIIKNVRNEVNITASSNDVGGLAGQVT